MPIPFHCSGCGKATKVPDSYGGKKVKCKCGAVVSVPAADVDLDDISFKPVEAERKPEKVAASTSKPVLSKRQREEKLLAEKLGQDWKNPTPQYHQVGHGREHWLLEVWYAMQGSPLIALCVMSASVLMICLGVLSFDNIAEQMEDSQMGGFGRRRSQRFLLGPILMGIGTLGAMTGVFVIVTSLLSPELKQHYPKWKIGLVIGGSAVTAAAFLAFILFRAIGGGS